MIEPTVTAGMLFAGALWHPATKQDLAQVNRRIDGIESEIKTFGPMLANHAQDVQYKHVENLRMGEKIESAVTKMGDNVAVLGSRVGDLEKLKPDIQRAVEGEHRREERKKLARRTITTVLSVLVAISTLLPLLQWLFSIRLSIKGG